MHRQFFFVNEELLSSCTLQNTKNTNPEMSNAPLILTWLKMKEYRSSPKLSVIAYKYVCKKKYDNFFCHYDWNKQS